MESVALHEHFPPLEEERALNLLPKSPVWEPLEGVSMLPGYQRTGITYSHAYTHAGWSLRLDGSIEEVPELLKAGATSIGIDNVQATQDGSIGKLLNYLKGTRIPFFVDQGGILPAAVRRFIKVARLQGWDLRDLRGAIAMDATESVLNQADMMAAARPTGLKTIRLTPMSWHLAGATHVQELAACISLLTCLLRNLNPIEVAARVYFSMPVGTRYLMNIARLRALRQLVSQVYSAFGLRNEEIFVEGVSSQRYESTLDRDTGLIRTTLQCLAAAAGGCNQIAIRGHTAQRIPLIMQHEAGLQYATDPAAGSWYIEELTDQLARLAWKDFQHMEALGGYAKGCQWLEKKVAEIAATRARQVRSGQQPLIGVNRYPDPDPEKTDAPPDETHLAGPFHILTRRVQGLAARPRVAVLDGPLKATEWVQYALACLRAKKVEDLCDADLVITFSLPQAAGLEVEIPWIAVLEAEAEEKTGGPVLLTGGDLVDAGHLVLDVLSDNRDA